MWRDGKGTVYVEFLLVFPPLFLLFLVILQSAILRATDLGLRHAASGAARSAIVIIPDDPVAYEGAPQNLISLQSSCSEGFVGKFHKVLGKLGVNSRMLPDDGKCLGGPRMSAIRFAAIMKMLPFSPNPQSILPTSLHSSIEALGTMGWLAGAAAYSYGATAVTFPKAPGSSQERDSYTFTDNEEVTVRVSYLAHCGIPIARFFMCDSGRSLFSKFDTDAHKRDLGGTRAARKRIKDAQSVLDKMSLSVGNRAIYFSLLVSGERFQVLSREATLPLNSAPYSYQVKGQ